MRRIFLIDCPGVVYPSDDSESDIVLKGVVSLVFSCQLHLPWKYCCLPKKGRCTSCSYHTTQKQIRNMKMISLLIKSTSVRMLFLAVQKLHIFLHQGSSGEDQKPRGAHWRRAGASKARIHSEDLPHPNLELSWRLSWEVGFPYRKTFEGLDYFRLEPNWSIFTQFRAAINTGTEMSVIIGIVEHFGGLTQLYVWKFKLAYLLPVQWMDLTAMFCTA